MATIPERLGKPWRSLTQIGGRLGLSAEPVSARVLELRLPPGWPQSEATIAWRLHGGHAPSRQGQVVGLAELPAEARPLRLHVWTPAAETLLTHTRLPTRSRAKILRALPYALEDQLLSEPDGLQFAYETEADGSLAVGVTARERLRVWRDQLAGAGLSPTSLSPLTLAVPLAPEGWSLAYDGAEAILRTGLRTGFVCPAEAAHPPRLLVHALREARERGAAPLALHVYQPPAGFQQSGWAEQLALPLVVHAEDYWWDAEPAPPPALNLLQGEFAVRRRYQSLAGPLLPATLMLALWAIGSLGFTLTQWWQLARAHRAYYGEMSAVLRQAFPDTTAILDPALQMQRNLEALEGRRGTPGASDLLPMLTRMAPVLQGQAGVTLRGLRYDHGGLTLDLALPDFAGLETLKSALAAQSLSVAVLAANSAENGVTARLAVNLATAPGGSP